MCTPLCYMDTENIGRNEVYKKKDNTIWTVVVTLEDKCTMGIPETYNCAVARRTPVAGIANSFIADAVPSTKSNTPWTGFVTVSTTPVATPHTIPFIKPLFRLSDATFVNIAVAPPRTPTPSPLTPE
ncbi:hypothetical protein GCK72_006093 [Caenorhabditis remanei]|uniref:Uncharacterized protein n=1 Tax=Caenorhabditis remanei TaxID=31234 RepID=A0A6A5HHC9_CAERE|nr:hypothetical protein GCK72_006093 [Caenorhabditis remanei]KAF1766137.1 hypothetical protein GCK72_006093 [Caenorhabditis remanei]